MPKYFAVLAALSLNAAIFAQPPTPDAASPSPTPTPAASPGPDVVLPSPSPSPTVDMTLSPMPSPVPAASVAGESEMELAKGYEWSEKGAPVFTIDKAIITALQQNPPLLEAKQEIERTRGVILTVAAQALPHVAPTFTFDSTDPDLQKSGFNNVEIGTGTGTGGGGTGGGARLPRDIHVTQYSYAIRVTGSQLAFNYGTFRQIRGSFFQRDSAYFGFRNLLDQTIANVTTQFYQVVVNRALIGVQEESVRLLESQLKDQENRFEAGTVPRFNVLQAQVQLSNQIPTLIAARNTYRISIITLAKTLGIDFNPRRANAAPIRVVGELDYVPRNIDLAKSIEFGKQSRAFLKQARANVLNAIEQVHVAIGGFLPNLSGTGGYEFLSSPFSTAIHDVARGWVWELQGNWSIWDSGSTYGQVKQQRALLSEAELTYDDDSRQVELEIQTAASNVDQNRELIQATEKTVEEAEESVRLAKARLDAGAGTQLDVLNAQVQLTTAESTRLQALFGYISSVAEFDRATGTQNTYTETFDDEAPRAAHKRTYYTGSDVDARGKPKSANPLAPDPVMPMSRTSTTTTTSTSK